MSLVEYPNLCYPEICEPKIYDRLELEDAYGAKFDNIEKENIILE